MALKIFLSKTPKMASSDFVNTPVSEPYVVVIYHIVLLIV